MNAYAYQTQVANKRAATLDSEGKLHGVAFQDSKKKAAPMLARSLHLLRNAQYVSGLTA